MWQELVDQVGCGIGHAPSGAAGAQTTLAGKANQALEATVGATEACETLCELATIQIAPELALDEAWIALAVRLACEERLEMLADEAMQDGLLWPARAIACTERSACCKRMLFVGDRRQARAGQPG